MLYYTTGGDDRQMDNFFLEKRLAEGNPDLHRRMTGSITVLRTMLEGYTVSFPQMTDHSILHSMDVIEYCNALLGKEQVELLLPEECYVLLMSCYLHDTGMCINPKDYEAFFIRNTAVCLSGNMQIFLIYRSRNLSVPLYRFHADTGSRISLILMNTGIFPLKRVS